MAFKLPPPPLGQAIDSFVWKDWLNRLQQAFTNLVLGVSQGGTGLTSVGSANQVLGVDATGTLLEYKTIVAGSNITVTPAAGSLTIAATGGGSGLTHPQVLTRVSFRM